MTVEIIPVVLEKKPVLSALMQKYRRDYREFMGDDVSHEGGSDFGPYYDLYWVEPTRHPYFIHDEGALVGLALAREYDHLCYEVAEFFVLLEHRRQGIGTAAALALFQHFKGSWRVAQDVRNTQAQTFWRKAIDQFSNGDFQESWSEMQPRGPMQTFLSTVD